ncbi:hypothetical protein Gotur_001990, partial [Gossypium turneri]
YDDSSSSSNSENTELFKKQYDEEKTSTDQDEDIKVSTYNFDEETTSSKDETIGIPKPMDTANPYNIKFDKNEKLFLLENSRNTRIEKVQTIIQQMKIGKMILLLFQIFNLRNIILILKLIFNLESIKNILYILY